MNTQWIELNGELYAASVEMYAKKRGRFVPGRMYQGNAALGGMFRRLMSRLLRK